MTMARPLGLHLVLLGLLVLSGEGRADSYQYDELGNVQTLTTPRGVRGYTYDQANRLDAETGYTGARDHAYDLNGNRSSDGAATPALPTTATFTAGSNRIATINGAAVTFDAAGQMINDGVNQYAWDDAGRLKTVSRAGVLRATYYYDYKDRRTRKVTTSAAPQGVKTILYEYDDEDRLVLERNGTGSWREPIRSYVWADQNLVAQVEYMLKTTTYSTGQTVTEVAVTRELLFELDHLGTPRQARLTDGTVVWRWESDGYGNTAPNQDPDGNGQATYVYLRFPGQYYDEESGLHYNGHRYYAPRLGRYLSSDPIGINGGNSTYAYVNGNPVRYADPRGLWSEEAHNYFIDEAFRGLDPSLIGALKAGSAFADSSQFQSGASVFMHAMSSDDLSPSESRSKMCKFIRAQIDAGNRHAASGRMWDAFAAYGMALHPIMDSTSPAHVGFQRWGGLVDSVTHGYGFRHGDAPGSLETLDSASGFRGATVKKMQAAMRGQLDDCGCQ